MSRRTKPNRYTPATNAVIDARLLADEIQKLCPNIRRGTALSKAVDIAEKAHGISLQLLKELLPSADYEDGAPYGVERRW